MAFDALVANPGRLRILTALVARRGPEEFIHLRAATGLTDGNLTTHARRLSAAGLVRIDKSFRAGKPVTTFTLTDPGRAALEQHTRELLQALEGYARTSEEAADADDDGADEPWID